MAELATLARPYAEALFQVASNGDLAQAMSQIDALARLTTDPNVQAFADSPKTRPEQVFDVLSSVVASPLSEASKNLLRIVIENGRLSVLPEIAAQFRTLVNQRTGVSDATVYSAFPIANAALAELTAALESRFGRRLNASVQVDPELIGGVRVVVGDEVLDTSVKARLEQMRAALTA